MNEIADYLLSAVKEKFKHEISNIPEILTYWHNVVYLFFSSVNYRRLLNTADVDFANMLSLGLIPLYLYDLFVMDKFIIEQHIKDAVEVYSSMDQDVNETRQQLLNIELDFTGDKIRYFSDKVCRDNTGAYYTPQGLALEIIQKAFRGRKFEQDSKYRIADFSCGGGDFFLAAMKYLHEEYGIEKKTSATWFYGVDIDPIALQICIVNLLQFSDRDDWKSIVSHFVFGNPLIISDHEHNEEEKNRLFATKRLYSVGLGMDRKYFDYTFDIVVGNPPWEKIRFEERKFFRGISDAISSMPQKSERDKAVEKLKETWPIVFEWREKVSNEYSKMTSAHYIHSKIKEAISGELNTYALFTELAYNMLSENGLLALVVKSTLVTAPVNQKLWMRLLDDNAVKGVYLFENRKKIFSIDSRERFIILILAKELTSGFEFAAGLTEPTELCSERTVILETEDLQKINPITKTIPNVGNTKEIDFLRRSHSQFKLFSEVYPNCHFGRLIHLTAHAASISRIPSSSNVPVYEGKFLEQYDARYATFRGMAESKKYANKASATKNDPDADGYKDWPESRFFVEHELWNKYLNQYSEKYSLCWRSLTSPTNRRTMLAMILPTSPTCQSVQMLQTADEEELVMLLALFNSIPFDYFVRIKMPGLDLTQSVIKQIPVPSPKEYEDEYVFNGVSCTLKKHILSYTVNLLKTEARLASLIRAFEGKIYAVEVTDVEENKKMIDLLFKKAYHLDDDSYKELLLSFSKYQVDHTA